MRLILKLFKILLGLFLLPFCLGSVKALWQILTFTGSTETIWLTALAGALCWILIYIFLPRPTWIYVLGHELTHAVWSKLFGGRLKKINVRSDGGHVLITKSNFLISLSPYFFPFYVVLIIIVFVIGNYFWNWTGYVLLFYFLIGLAYAFHITLTGHALRTKQSDITGEGYIFSAVIIFLGNMFVLLIGIPLLTHSVRISTSLTLCYKYSIEIYGHLASLLH